MSRFSLRRITSEEDFRSLERPWNEILSENENLNVFSTFEWLSTWWKHFKKNRRLHILAAEKEGRITAILPAFLEKHRSRSLLQLLGRPASDYCDVLCRPQDASFLPEILDAIRSQEHEVNQLWWEGLRQDSSIYAALARRDARKPFLEERLSSYSTLHVKIDRGWEDYLERLGAKHVRDIRRKKRRLQEEGNLQFGSCENGGARKFAASLLEEKRRQYRGTPNDGTFAADGWGPFLDEITGIFLEKQWLDLPCLTLDGKAIARMMNFIYRKRVFCYMTAFSPEFAVNSPGKILFYEVLRRVHEDGMLEIDFLTGDENYKKSWAPDKRNVYSFNAYRRNARALYFVLQDKLLWRLGNK